MDKKEFKKVIETALEGKWVLEYDKPTKWWHFFPTSGKDENELGKVIVATSSDFIENRQRIEYELVISDDLKEVVINFYDKDNSKMIEYLLYQLNSHTHLWVDEPNGKKWNYRKDQIHDEIPKA